MAAPQLVSEHIARVSNRRESNRFPLYEEARYRLLRSKSNDVRGAGKTLNASSGGILFTTQSELPKGRVVELALTWPARLGGICPLQLVAVGRVVRSDATQAAIRIEKYEFKTRRLS